MFTPQQKKSFYFRCLASVINVCFIVSFISPIRAFAQTPAELGLPQPGSMIGLTESYAPVMVKGLRVHPENPILFDFIVDTGNSGATDTSTQLKAESEKLIKYFLASLTIPEEDLWVNLSPYEKDRIITDQLGQTDMGRDMLAQDYILKQLTASLIYPEKELGREFWNKVYAKAQALYGSSEIPVNTFNKVWIVADKAKVFVHDNTAFVVASHLKVMLEEDYLALEKNTSSVIASAKGGSAFGGSETAKQSDTKKIATSPSAPRNDTSSLGSQIVRDIVLPELEKEVNQGKNFANLRQIFHSMILAAWYKKNLKEALLNQVYSNKAKINGVDTSDKTIKDQIYREYLKAYKKGVFNYIKEDPSTDAQGKPTGQRVARKYFSGGVLGKLDLAQTSNPKDADAAMFIAHGPEGRMFRVSVTTPRSNPASKKDRAMASSIVLDDSVVRLVSQSFGKYLQDTMKQRAGVGEMSHLNSFFRPATGQERGDFIGVDFSGTNLKVVLVRMQPGEKPKVLEVKESKFPEELKNKSSREVFAFVASVVQKLPLEQAKTYSIGLSFAFPMSHQSMGKAEVLRLAKGWNLSDIIGKNPGVLLEQSLGDNFKVVGIMNDTIATQLASPGAVSGIILGTGSNFSITDAWGNIINLEAGNTTVLDSVRTASDHIIFRNSDPAGKQMFEKMVSGKYLVQLLHEEMRSLANANPESNYQRLVQSPKWGRTESLFLGKLSLAKDKLEIITVIHKFLGDDIAISETEARKIQVISQRLLKRSGQLLGSAIAQVLKQVKGTQRKKIVIDGSVYWENELVRQGFSQALALEGYTDQNLDIVNVKNASAVGAAIGAAVASQPHDKGDVDGQDVSENGVTEEVWQEAERVGLSQASLMLEFYQKYGVGFGGNLMDFVRARTVAEITRKRGIKVKKDAAMTGIKQVINGVIIDPNKFVIGNSVIIDNQTGLQDVDLGVLIDPIRVFLKKKASGSLRLPVVLENIKLIITGQDHHVSIEILDAAMTGDQNVDPGVEIDYDQFSIEGDKVVILNQTGRKGGVALADYAREIANHLGQKSTHRITLRNIKIVLTKGGIQFPDFAMATQKPPGGIDLNSKNMQLDEAGQKIDIRFDPAMIQQFKAGDFSGVRPVILNITPIIDMRPLLGLAPFREEEQLVKV